ncbi:MAG TPA: ATP-binding protein [Candidatus Udaeobacter sp.]|jgi:signal transduction histidine kinase
MEKNNSKERFLILAPVGGDAQAMAQLLVRHGFGAQICGSIAECCAQLKSGSDALVLTEEALELANVSELLQELGTQPAWSELPLIILTTGGESRLARLLELAATAAGSVTLLERPIGSTTLLRTLEVALNSRRRQYQVRDLLEEQRRNERQLRLAHEQLADRARQLETIVELRTAKLAQSNERLRREIAEREQAEIAREALRRKLLHAQEEERRRIARELHDQMGQNLTALNLGLKSLLDSHPGSDLHGRVQHLQELATQTARDLHRVALELRPAALDDLGLVKAIRSLAETWSKRCCIDVDFEAGQYEPAGISSEVETTLYRVIQEALNNVAKHSRATRVGLILGRTPDHVQAIIEDNGRGFDVDRVPQAGKANGQLGLLGIQERLGMVGGSLNLESAPAHGATLIVRVPIPKST